MQHDDTTRYDDLPATRKTSDDLRELRARTLARLERIHRIRALIGRDCAAHGHHLLPSPCRLDLTGEDYRAASKMFVGAVAEPMNEPVLVIRADTFSPWEEPGVIPGFARITMTRSLLERIAALAALVRELDVLAIEACGDDCTFCEAAEDDDGHAIEGAPIRTELHRLRVQHQRFRFEAHLKNCEVTFHTEYFWIDEMQARVTAALPPDQHRG